MKGAFVLFSCMGFHVKISVSNGVCLCVFVALWYIMTGDIVYFALSDNVVNIMVNGIKTVSCHIMLLFKRYVDDVSFISIIV